MKYNKLYFIIIIINILHYRHNRQFRFEEKDNHGHIKGHYGYYDKSGKLQVVNYEADPEHGFKADPA